MLKDECILVDEADNITGHANKYNSHRHAGQGGAGRGGAGAGRVVWEGCCMFRSPT